MRRELFASREQARQAIDAGDVTVNGAPVNKPARLVQAGDAILVLARQRFVGRGGDKLEGAIQAFDLDVTGATCIDVGSSTGGFTDSLLQRGVAHVVAVDVGTHQLHERLRADKRVDVREQTDIRDVTVDSLPRPADVLVCDVSFIGIEQVFPKMLELGAPEADYILLIKPQFEAGRQEVSKGRGVIRDPEIWARVLAESWHSIEECGGRIRGACVSPLKGGSGNVEFFYWVTLADGADVAPNPQATIEPLVRQAQDLT